MTDKEIELEECPQKNRDQLQIGITEKHDFDEREADISNPAWRLAVEQGAKEAEMEKIRKRVIPNTHVAKLAAGKE